METIKDVDDEDPNQIYLVDHAWTFRTDQARQQLCQVPGLASRMAALMDIEEEDDEVVVETVLEKMWRYCQTYSIGNAGSVEDRQPHWYIMDLKQILKASPFSLQYKQHSRLFYACPHLSYLLMTHACYSSHWK